jgi:hypothetical protein
VTCAEEETEVARELDAAEKMEKEGATLLWALGPGRARGGDKHWRQRRRAVMGCRRGEQESREADRWGRGNLKSNMNSKPDPTLIRSKS